MLLLFIIWEAIGFMTICVTLIVHTYKAEKAGYKAIDYLRNYNKLIKSCGGVMKNRTTSIPMVILRCIVWPVLLIDVVVGIKNQYEEYERY